MFGDKKRFRKILKKYTKSNINNSSLKTTKNYLPNSIIDMYNYSVNDYFNQDEEKENEGTEELTSNKKHNEEINSLINSQKTPMTVRQTLSAGRNFLPIMWVCMASPPWRGNFGSPRRLASFAIRS